MTKCTFCSQHAENYTEPPMCEQHAIIAQTISTMKGWGWPSTSITVQSVQNYLFFNGNSAIHLADVPDLCATMPEFET